MTEAARRVLVLHWQEPFRRVRPTIRQHLRLFEASPAGHAVHYANLALGVPPPVRRARFDVVVLHTTLLCARWFPQFAEVRDRVAWVADADTFKVALPQDEYDHAGVLDDWLAELGIDLIGTNFSPAHQPILYPRMHRTGRFLKCLTGYIDAGTARTIAPRLRPPATRPLDLVYRANHLPYWFGSHGQLKHEIAVRVKSAADRLGLRADISTAPRDTIGSDRWYEFLASARATIGCESGSSALDARGEIRAAVRRLLADRPDLSFDEVSAHLPHGWDSHRFFAIGPRHLEAVITRTCQVLVEGEYDGILRPGAHYLPVRRDFGNLDEVLAMVRDDALVEKVTRQAYEDVFLSGRFTYAAAAQAFDGVLPSEPVGPRRPGSDAVLRARLGGWELGRLAVRAVRGGLRAARRRLFRPSAVSPPTRPQSQVTVP
jgi:hypothetical protein